MVIKSSHFIQGLLPYRDKYLRQLGQGPLFGKDEVPKNRHSFYLVRLALDSGDLLHTVHVHRPYFSPRSGPGLRGVSASGRSLHECCSLHLAYDSINSRRCSPSQAIEDSLPRLLQETEE